MTLKVLVNGSRITGEKIPTTKVALILILTWLCIGLFNFGVLNADFSWKCQNEWPNICDRQLVEDDRISCIMFGLFAAPITLPTALAIFVVSRHGWTLKAQEPLVKSERGDSK